VIRDAAGNQYQSKAEPVPAWGRERPVARCICDLPIFSLQRYDANLVWMHSVVAGGVQMPERMCPIGRMATPQTEVEVEDEFEPPTVGGEVV
jgi:hypothetical protein